MAILEPQEDRLGIMVRGERHLWSDLLHAYQDWFACGMPGLEAYTLRIDQSNRQVVSIDEYQKITRTFPLTDEGVFYRSENPDT